MLSDGQMSALRSTQERLMTDTCTVYARSLSGDGQAGRRESWDDGTSVSCRVAPMSKETLAMFAAKLGTSSGWVFTVAHDTTVNAEDKVEYDGDAYRVLGTNAHESYITAKRVYCARSKNG